MPDIAPFPSSDVDITGVSTEPQDKMFDWREASIHINRMIRSWEEESSETCARRKKRKVSINIDELHQTGKLDEDETIVPVRVIDTNISREIPTYVNYIKNSRRICTFRCISDPTIDSQLIEEEFSRGMTYTKWEVPHFKTVDGALAHGWDAVEVVYDESKPFNVAIEHIGHDQLIFPLSTKDLQQAPRILRVYDVTFIQLRSWVNNFGFNAEQVERIISKIQDTNKETETVRIYKLFFKKDGIVYSAWCADKHEVTDWLKAPAQHIVGIGKMVQMPSTIDPLTGQMLPGNIQFQNEPLKLYPVFLLNYRECEEQEQIEHEGRVYLDEHKQEAQTAILSGFINGLTRASNLYASQSADDGSGDSLKEVADIKLKGGRVLSKKVDFFHPDYPDPMVIKALQYFDVANSQETNQPNFAALNREDSRKTATEMNAAMQSKVEINSVQLTLYSAFIREVYSFVWLIVQSQALQGSISFLVVPIQTPVINPVTGQPVTDEMGQPVIETNYQNNTQVIGQLWELRAAGDVDVIRRAEIEQKMQQDWAIVSQTPLAMPFLMDYIKLRYPEAGDRYAQQIAQLPMVQQLQQQVSSMGVVMQGMLEKAPQLMEGLSPQEQQQIQQMIQQSAPPKESPAAQ